MERENDDISDQWGMINVLLFFINDRALSSIAITWVESLHALLDIIKSWSNGCDNAFASDG